MAKEDIGGSNSFGDKWNPSRDADSNRREKADPKKDYIEGFLILHESKTFGTNQNPSECYTVEIAQHPDDKGEYTGFGTEGGKVSFFGCTVLDNKILEAEKKYGPGCWLRIEYAGMELKKAAKQIKEKNPKKIMEDKDHVKLFNVIGDPEIPAKKVAGQPEYKAAPTPSVNSTPQNAPLPDSLEETGVSKDEMPDDLDLG